jgi:hypothetical protein
MRHKTIFTKGKIMKAKNILLNAIYHFMLGRNEVQGEVVETTDNGWNVRLITSDKVVKVNNADRFVRKARTIATTGNAPVEERKATRQSTCESMSALDAAHKVLVECRKALTVRQITEAILEKGYSPNLKGETPQLTISAAIQREIKAKGSASRFCKAEKGLFRAAECQCK